MTKKNEIKLIPNDCKFVSTCRYRFILGGLCYNYDNGWCREFKVHINGYPEKDSETK